MKKILSALVVLSLLATPVPSRAQSAVSSQQLVCFLHGANMNVTTDQLIPVPAAKWSINKIIVTNASTSLTLAAGGFYTATSKGGTIVVLAAQTYSALTGGTLSVSPTLTAAGSGTAFTVPQLYLSLTTAQGAAATADIYVIVDVLP